jgi:hypothetical protein
MNAFRKHGLAMSYAVALCCSATSIHAQTSPQDDGSLRMNCAGDYFRFCSSYSPGSVEIKQCFAANTERLTPECRNAIRVFDRRNGNRS